MEYLSDVKELTRDVWSTAKPREIDPSDLKGRVYIVTGGSSGIGFEAARYLIQAGAKVYITGGTPANITRAVDELSNVKQGEVHVLPLNNLDLSSIKPAVTQFLQQESRLDGILHNAGINYRGQNYTKDGLLDIIQVNVVAPWLLQKLLDSLLIQTGSSRIVWVTSAIHFYSPPCGGIDWENMSSFDSGGYLGAGNGMYGQTKAMNIYEAVLWAKHHKDTDVISVSAHPGTIVSDIRRVNRWRKFVMELWARPTTYGALAELDVLLSKDIRASDNGAYFIPFAQHGHVRNDVWEAANGPRGDKFLGWITEITDKYV